MDGPGGTWAATTAWRLAEGLGPLRATESNLQLTSPLVWVMVGIGAAGAVVTFAFLVYAVVRFRDPATRGRRYG